VTILDPSLHQVAAVLVLLGIAAAVSAILITKRRIDAQHAAVLVVFALFIIAFVVWSQFRHLVMRLLGVGLPASALFLLIIFVQGFVNLYFASRLTKLSACVRRLTQEIALLNSWKHAGREEHSQNNSEDKP
jgi:hypothetical protein